MLALTSWQHVIVSYTFSIILRKQTSVGANNDSLDIVYGVYYRIRLQSVVGTGAAVRVGVGA